MSNTNFYKLVTSLVRGYKASAKRTKDKHNLILLKT
jgi:hypothetical protein